MSLKHVLLPAAFASILVLAGCSKKTAAAPAAPAEVGVISVAPSAITLTRELPGRTSAFLVAEVRARVSGIVLQRHFTEGGDVKEGQLLYTIDPAPYQAALDSAKANLARADANAAVIRLQADRSKKLIDARAISQQEYDDVAASHLAAEADVAAAKAAVQTADINIGYTRVAAPVSGRIGLSQVTQGAYVQQGTATLLATIQQLDPLYVDLTQSSTDVLRLRRDLAAGKLQRAGESAAKAELLLDDNSVYSQNGTLQFSDVTVNASTNSITLRAIFPNPKNELLPGMFVRARLQEGTTPDAILVPQLAITRNSKGEATALVVGAENKVELRVLRTDRAVGNQWLIADGLKAGDQVIVQNLQRIRPGAVVKPVPATNVPASTVAAR
ncbi:efflux RND transporter periplasmic adaptor subunit [Rariglobus hedericola]|uniref:Efflux RND transporter periplasmic adaptor subunit n=1 Tax=Rariglobus hedericola TaxID=2597822 RepID=A0A556QQL2_9BACT|nr:efflux RND transporter periplasmic adaptor subunit [Rariglobus hedericola]TSJ78922.1 efflux RND transporter periplasmic adaptor subunit [Rariglobus hedericola]